VLLVTVTAAHAERLPIRVYTVEDGLAHARVRRIVRDPRGFLWFCTIDGLSRFDGAEFVTYRTADGLPDPWVTDLLTTRDGAYWVATNGGVARFDGTRRVAPDGRRPAEDRPGQLFSPVAFEGQPTQPQVRVLLKIAPVVSGRAVGVVSSCWTKAVRYSHSGPSSRALRRWSRHW
jgi:ligand-binding sensor domain-containing protein